MATRPLQPGDPREAGPYRLLARLGSGGMGVVFLGRSAGGRTVAIKLVREDLARDPEFRRRFRNEVRAAREVAGRFTAAVLDADTEAATPWLATAYIAGPTLQEVVDGDDGPLPERSLLPLAAGLGGALRAIHERGVVHRDLKPSNVLLTLDGPRVIDFGIARAVNHSVVTRTGSLIGTPAFMSPEQIRGERVTPASDVFALGSVLAYAATGRMPFATTEDGVHALMMRITMAEPDLDGLPGTLRGLVGSCLAKDPSARPLPQEIIERAAASGATEPWLPPKVMDRLGRRAVALLDLEAPVSRPPPADRPTSTPPASTPPPSVTPASAPPTGVPSVPPPRRFRAPAIAGAALAPLALIGVVLYVANLGDDGAPASGTAATASSARATPAASPSTPRPSPTAPTPSPRRSAVPSALVGTWEGPSSDDETLRFTIRRGRTGSDVVTERFTDRRLTCHLVGRLEWAGARGITVTARISQETHLSCKFDTGTQTLTLTDEGILVFRAENGSVSGSLRRAG
ncbi:serine/threonine-protein kinase [Actinomadura sp. NBRC 104412]|uniref:serine/threonine-protein kinase n=1 Tax=Actinomadura sp. NBRC 104412 TaxID=3032203 RepID=UPI0025547136|nr:serine/threonine-protein kinase [Actinomadura sp. NBRC 104412]